MVLPVTLPGRPCFKKPGAMKQRILSYRMPPCHRVTAHECSSALQHFHTSTECCLEFARRLSNVS